MSEINPKLKATADHLLKCNDLSHGHGIIKVKWDVLEKVVENQ